jgi:hypothetical protein
MHQRTFERLCERIGDVEEQRDTLFVIGAARLLGFRSFEDLLG